jgi:hypothetical protein
VHIAALICAAEFFDDRGDHGTGEFVRDYADFLESHIESWTVTTQGTPVPWIRRHYIRVNPASAAYCTDEDPNCGTLVLANQPPGARYEFPANEIVDAGFLELVRYGIFTILQLNIWLSCLPRYVTASASLQCRRCNASCSTNSSIERARIEKPQEHFDSRKKTWFCTTGFLLKS